MLLSVLLAVLKFQMLLNIFVIVHYSSYMPQETLVIKLDFFKTLTTF